MGTFWRWFGELGINWFLNRKFSVSGLQAGGGTREGVGAPWVNVALSSKVVYVSIFVVVDNLMPGLVSGVPWVAVVTTPLVMEGKPSDAFDSLTIQSISCNLSRDC
jgi:hypothetical protein